MARIPARLIPGLQPRLYNTSPVQTTSGAASGSDSAVEQLDLRFDPIQQNTRALFFAQDLEKRFRDWELTPVDERDPWAESKPKIIDQAAKSHLLLPYDQPAIQPALDMWGVATDYLVEDLQLDPPTLLDRPSTETPVDNTSPQEDHAGSIASPFTETAESQAKEKIEARKARPLEMRFEFEAGDEQETYVSKVRTENNPAGIQEMEAFLENKEALRPYAQDFIDAGRQFHLDPFALASIAWQRTDRGNSMAIPHFQNAMVVEREDGAGPVLFSSVRASIYAGALELHQQVLQLEKGAQQAGDAQNRTDALVHGEMRELGWVLLDKEQDPEDNPELAKNPSIPISSEQEESLAIENADEDPIPLPEATEDNAPEDPSPTQKTISPEWPLPEETVKGLKAQGLSLDNVEVWEFVNYKVDHEGYFPGTEMLEVIDHASKELSRIDRMATEPGPGMSRQEFRMRRGIFLHNLNQLLDASAEVGGLIPHDYLSRAQARAEQETVEAITLGKTPTVPAPLMRPGYLEAPKDRTVSPQSLGELLDDLEAPKPRTQTSTGPARKVNQGGRAPTPPPQKAPPGRWDPREMKGTGENIIPDHGFQAPKKPGEELFERDEWQAMAPTKGKLGQQQTGKMGPRPDKSSAIYTSKSREHLGHSRHHAISTPKPNKSRFFPTEGGQKFTDEVINHQM